MRDESKETDRERGLERTWHNKELWRWGEREKEILRGR